MKEYIKDATEASEEEELLISYDKEKALYELGNSEGYKRGEKFEYAKGEQSGYSKGIYKVAKNLLKSNLKIEEVSKYTGLTEKELSTIK